MTVQALAWAIEQAPDVPQHNLSVLIALANHAHEDGTDAWPSIERIAWESRKSERQVQRALAELEELGLIRRGDQRAAYKVPERYRPIVYDLAMERTRERYVPRRLRGVGDAAESADAPNRDDAHVVPVIHRDDAHVALATTPTSYEPITQPLTTSSSRSSTHVSRGSDAPRPMAPHCTQCDETGTAYLTVDGESTSTQCRHNGYAANERAVRDRWAVTRRRATG